MSAGLAALATFLKGGGQIAGKVIEEKNRSIAGQNRDEVMRWAEDASMEWANEQRKIEEANKRLAAVGMPVPQDVGQAKAFYASQGVNPAAVGTTPEQFAAAAAPSPVDVVDESNKQGAIAAGMDSKQAEATGKMLGAKRELAGVAGKVATSARAATDLQGGQASMEERTTKRQWNDPLASALLPEATRFMSSTLQRQERGTGDLDAEERRLVKKMGLAQGYSSYLQKEDLESIRESLKGLSDARRDRIMEDKGVRGDQVQIGTGLIGYGRAMEQTATAAEARSALEDKKSGVKVGLETMKERGRNNRNAANINARRGMQMNDLIYKDAKEKADALRDFDSRSGNLWATAKKLRGQAKLDFWIASGVPMRTAKGWISDGVEPDYQAFHAAGRKPIEDAAVESGKRLTAAAAAEAERSGIAPSGKPRGSQGSKSDQRAALRERKDQPK